MAERYLSTRRLQPLSISVYRLHPPRTSAIASSLPRIGSHSSCPSAQSPQTLSSTRIPIRFSSVGSPRRSHSLSRDSTLSRPSSRLSKIYSIILIKFSCFTAHQLSSFLLVLIRMCFSLSSVNHSCWNKTVNRSSAICDPGS